MARSGEIAITEASYRLMLASSSLLLGLEFLKLSPCSVLPRPVVVSAFPPKNGGLGRNVADASSSLLLGLEASRIHAQYCRDLWSSSSPSGCCFTFAIGKLGSAAICAIRIHVHPSSSPRPPQYITLPSDPTMPTHALTHDLISSGRTRPTHLVLEVLIHELLPPALAFHLPVLGLAHFAHAEGAIPEQQHQVVADPPKGILHPEPGTSQSISDAPPPGPHREPIRRTPRKPVPQYNLADPALASPPPPAHASDSSSREERMCTGRSQDWLNLSHKASFGAEGRTVHYLIPDMPLPQLN